MKGKDGIRDQAKALGVYAELELLSFLGFENVGVDFVSIGQKAFHGCRLPRDEATPVCLSKLVFLEIGL